jgi:hypothetical protein
LFAERLARVQNDLEADGYPPSGSSNPGYTSVNRFAVPTINDTDRKLKALPGFLANKSYLGAIRALKLTTPCPSKFILPTMI